MYASLASRRRSVLTQPGLQVFAVNDPKHEQDTLGIEQVVREPVVPDPQAAEGICGALNSKSRSERHRARTDQRVRGRRPHRLHPDPSGRGALTVGSYGTTKSVELERGCLFRFAWTDCNLHRLQPVAG
jgi:hypothetical protein